MDNPYKYVYIVHANEDEKRCKIGYWTSSLKLLHSRYSTYYGSDLKLYSFATLYPILAETLFKLTYQCYHIINEIYNIQYIEEYKIFFERMSSKNENELNNYILSLNSENFINTGNNEIILVNDSKIYLKIKQKDRYKKAPYTCIRCGYETMKKSCMNQHLNMVKKPCAATNNDIKLTDEIKNYILINRIYRITENLKAE
jgi:hypothetical protein